MSLKLSTVLPLLQPPQRQTSSLLPTGVFPAAAGPPLSPLGHVTWPVHFNYSPALHISVSISGVPQNMWLYFSEGPLFGDSVVGWDYLTGTTLRVVLSTVKSIVAYGGGLEVQD